MPASTRTAPAVIAGSALVAFSLAVLVVGAFVVGLHATQRDGDGYYASGHHHLSTPTRALVSDGLDIRTGDAPGWTVDDGRLGTLRVTASGTGANPVFVGIAPAATVNRYLRGVDRDEVADRTATVGGLAEGVS